MDSKLDRVEAQNQGDLTQPTLILCEGKRDASFVLHLAERRGINGIQVGFPDRVTSDRYGNEGFKEYLRKLRIRSGFRGLRHIVIFRDRNGDGPKAFRDVAQQITEAERYDVPEALEQETGGTPGITVRLIPDTATEGNLDVLLLSAIEAEHPKSKCFNPYFGCCEINTMPVGKAAKIKLTTIVAASCQDNPSCSLAWVWSEPGNPIPLDSRKFDEIAGFLRRFD